MTAQFKVYKRFSKQGVEAAKGRPIVQVGDLYLVPTDSSTADLQSTEVKILGIPANRATYQYAGQITLGHLNRLGNANHAVVMPKWRDRLSVFSNHLTGPKAPQNPELDAAFKRLKEVCDSAWACSENSEVSVEDIRVVLTELRRLRSYEVQH
jgi:hypothetical protein